MIAPKYSLFEHERRFVVGPARCPALDPATAVRIDDLYVYGGRLRLRSNTAADGTVILKLAKKYVGDTPMSRPMTNLYLDGAEFEVLSRLPGRRLRKRRHRLAAGFVVDVFEDALDGLILAELEADAATVANAELPIRAAAEVTADPHYDGGKLCHWTSDDLEHHRALYG